MFLKLKFRAIQHFIFRTFVRVEFTPHTSECATGTATIIADDTSPEILSMLYCRCSCCFGQYLWYFGAELIASTVEVGRVIARWQ